VGPSIQRATLVRPLALCRPQAFPALSLHPTGVRTAVLWEGAESLTAAYSGRMAEHALVIRTRSALDASPGSSNKSPLLWLRIEKGAEWPLTITQMETKAPCTCLGFSVAAIRGRKARLLGWLRASRKSTRKGNAHFFPQYYL